jgi:hypothetical protein
MTVRDDVTEPPPPHRAPATARSAGARVPFPYQDAPSTLRLGVARARRRPGLANDAADAQRWIAASRLFNSSQRAAWNASWCQGGWCQGARPATGVVASSDANIGDV